MHGLNMGIAALNALFCDNDIICVQEVWVKPNELHRVQFLHTEFDCYVVSAMANVWHNKVFMGRPFGGLAIFWKKSLFHNMLSLGYDMI
jgi:exonuclease III